MDLRYFTPPGALPTGVTREALPELRDRELKEANPQKPGARPLSDVYEAMNERLKTYEGMDLNQQERAEYQPYPDRARQRALLLLQAAQSAGAGAAGGGAAARTAPTSSPVTQPSQ
jgi:hypothetical protein